MTLEVNRLLSKFRINVNHIINNTDNTIEDIKSEAYLVLHTNLERIELDERVFINELKNNCLKFNKYNRVMNTKVDWERFNRYEERLQHEYSNGMEIDEDMILGLHLIKDVADEEEYQLLLDYYRYGQKLTSEKYNMKEGTIRKRVFKLIQRLKKELE
ncbi:MAG: hypothetical protein ACRC6B_12375 [Fusobacteriaceae bacterium]